MPSSPTLPPGTCIGDRYLLGPILGRGGSSVVYEAVDQQTGASVAAKVLDPEPEHRFTERERLFREARITAGLDHPGIVDVLDAGPLPDGRAFLVMERLLGHTLAQRLDGCFWMPLEEAVPIATALLSALDAAHRVGVIHRDVKPANVFLLQSGAVKLIDFGIGRDLGDPASRVTAPDVVVGTLGYMAPEQLFGEDPNASTDVYALGATLYEALAGRLPHGDIGNDMHSVFAAMARAPAPLAELRPALPEPLASGVMKALSKSPRDRPKTCRDLAALCGLEVAHAA